MIRKSSHYWEYSVVTCNSPKQRIGEILCQPDREYNPEKQRKVVKRFCFLLQMAPDDAQVSNIKLGPTQQRFEQSKWSDRPNIIWPIQFNMWKVATRNLRKLAIDLLLISVYTSHHQSLSYLHHIQLFEILCLKLHYLEGIFPVVKELYTEHCKIVHCTGEMNIPEKWNQV